MNLWYWTSERSNLPLWNRPVEGINFGCLFQLPSWFVLVCVYAGSHIWLCTRTLVCIGKHWPACVNLCTCFGVLLNSKGYSYHKKKRDLMSKHLPCLAFPFNVSLLCSIFTVTSSRKCMTGFYPHEGYVCLILNTQRAPYWVFMGLADISIGCQTPKRTRKAL